MSSERLATSTLLFTVAMLGFNALGSDRTFSEAIPLSLLQGAVFATFVYGWEWYKNRKK